MRGRRGEVVDLWCRLSSHAEAFVDSAPAPTKGPQNARTVGWHSNGPDQDQQRLKREGRRPAPAEQQTAGQQLALAPAHGKRTAAGQTR